MYVCMYIYTLSVCVMIVYVCMCVIHIRHGEIANQITKVKLQIFHNCVSIIYVQTANFLVYLKSNCKSRQVILL